MDHFARVRKLDYTRKLGVTVIITCLVLRLLFFCFYQPWTPDVERDRVLTMDALGYHLLAVSLVEHHRFIESDISNLDAIRPPLYPLFIAVIYKIAGQQPWLVLLIQVLLDCIACLLLFVALNRCLSPGIAFTASLLYALNPYQIWHCSVLASESLFIFLLIAFFFFVVNALTSQTRKRQRLFFALAAFFLGLSALVRPITLYIPVFLVIFLFIVYRRQAKQALICSLLVLLVFSLILLPWLTRNYLTYGHFSLSTSGSFNLLILNTASMVAAQQQRNLGRVQQELLAESVQMMKEEGKDPEKLNSFQKAEYWKKLSVQYITAHPVDFIKTYCTGVLRIFISLGTSGFLQMFDFPDPSENEKPNITREEKIKLLYTSTSTAFRVIAIILVIFLMAVYISMITGGITAWKKYRGETAVVLIFALLMALYFILITGAAGNVAARFKVPVLPFLFPFASIGFEKLGLFLKRRRK